MKKRYHRLDDGKRWMAIWYPVLTLVRRIVFVFTIIFFPAFTWLQLATTFLFIQGMWCYLIYFYPMEDLFTNRMEIFGELTNLGLMYHMMLFTDFVSDAAIRYGIGYSFIFFVTIFISVHLYFMLRGTMKQIKDSLYKRCAKKGSANAKAMHFEKNKSILSEYDPKSHGEQSIDGKLIAADAGTLRQINPKDQ